MSRSLFRERYWSLRDHGPFKSFALLPSFSTEALHLTYLLCLLPTELLFYCVTFLKRFLPAILFRAHFYAHFYALFQRFAADTLASWLAWASYCLSSTRSRQTLF